MSTLQNIGDGQCSTMSTLYVFECLPVAGRSQRRQRHGSVLAAEAFFFVLYTGLQQYVAALHSLFCRIINASWSEIFVVPLVLKFPFYPRTLSLLTVFGMQRTNPPAPRHAISAHQSIPDQKPHCNTCT
jgi:hypothetical protein